MISVLDILFYGTLIPFYCGVFAVLKRWVPPLSLSGLLLVTNLVFVVVPGYFNYRGGITYEDSSPINTTAYILYFLQAVLPPFAVYASWRLSGPPILRVRKRLGIKPLYVAVLVAVVAYDVAYIVANASQIPLISIFTDFDFTAVSLLRSQLTHGISDTDVPWYFTYQRIFTKDLIFLLVVPLFLFGRFWRSLPQSLLCCAVLFLLLMHAEKGYLLFFVTALYIARSNFRPPSLKTVMLMSAAVVVLSFLLTYALFAQDVATSLKYVPIRLSGQTGYVVPQLEVAQQYGFLGIRGIRLGVFDRLFSIDYVDISSLTFSEVHSDLAQAGVEGSSAGSSMAELYMIAGYLSPLLFFIAIYLIAQLDKNLRVFATTFRGQSDFNARLAKTFYIYFVCFYSLEPMTSVFNIFSPVTIFQPPLLLAALLFSLFFRVSFRVKAHAPALSVCA